MLDSCLDDEKEPLTEVPLLDVLQDTLYVRSRLIQLLIWDSLSSDSMLLLLSAILEGFVEFWWERFLQLQTVSKYCVCFIGIVYP